MIDPLKATIAIGNDRGEIRGSMVQIETPNGTFQIGYDNDGCVYVSTHNKALFINPQASNRIRIEQR